MNYIEKVKYLIEEAAKREYDRDKYYIDITPEKNSWKPGEIEEVTKGYDYIPESYIEFIKEFDFLGLSYATFYGSVGVDGIVLAEEIEFYKPHLKMDYFPFAKDPSWTTFAFNRKQQVVFFDCVLDPECENEPELIAENFVEFIDDCVMGKRLPEFAHEDSKYMSYIKSLGWLDPK